MIMTEHVVINIEEMSWPAWKAVEQKLIEPGWSVALFPIKTSCGRADFKVGTVRDFIGIYAIMGTITHVEPENGAIDLREGAVVHQLVHLPTGIHIALLDSRPDAVRVAELALSVEEWRHAMLNDKGWRIAAARTQELCFLCGLVVDEAHRVNLGLAGEHPLMHSLLEVLEIGRPEKLS